MLIFYIGINYRADNEQKEHFFVDIDLPSHLLKCPKPSFAKAETLKPIVYFSIVTTFYLLNGGIVEIYFNLAGVQYVFFT